MESLTCCVRLSSPTFLLKRLESGSNSMGLDDPFVLHDCLWVSGWRCEVVPKGYRRPRGLRGLGRFEYREAAPLVFQIGEGANTLPALYMKSLQSSTAIFASGHIKNIPAFKPVWFYKYLLKNHMFPETKAKPNLPMLEFSCEDPSVVALPPPPAPRQRKRKPEEFLAGAGLLDEVAEGGQG